MARHVCTYDNPSTFRRECWQDGVLICSHDATLLLNKRFNGHPKYFFFGANIGPWEKGKLVGNREAMKGSRMARAPEPIEIGDVFHQRKQDRAKFSHRRVIAIVESRGVELIGYSVGGNRNFLCTSSTLRRWGVKVEKEK